MNLSNQEVFDHTHKLVTKEREVTHEILKFIREIESWRIYAEHGYSCLISMIVTEFKYSHGAAERRIQAMRVLKEIPQIESKIVDGSLTLP